MVILDCDALTHQAARSRRAVELAWHPIADAHPGAARGDEILLVGTFAHAAAALLVLAHRPHPHVWCVDAEPFGTCIGPASTVHDLCT
jgi:hypothetical protein